MRRQLKVIQIRKVNKTSFTVELRVRLRAETVCHTRPISFTSWRRRFVYTHAVTVGLNSCSSLVVSCHHSTVVGPK